jgi:nucleoside-diphosphate-sugar epimerase
MNVFMVGGTGLLGSVGAAELIARGHQVAALALPPLPPGSVLPPQMDLYLGDVREMADEDILSRLRGCEVFVFAAGVDERIEGPPPVYNLFYRHNIAPLERLLRLAKQAGVRRAVVLGSYFTHFDRIWPHLELGRHHPYIRSRIDQAAMALGFSDSRMAVCVLELPYIFGIQHGRRPIWVFLAEQLLAMPGNLAFYPRGGTAMVTVRQVGQAIAAAAEKGEGGRPYPIGWFNLTWKQLLAICYRYLDQPNRKIITIPDWLFRLQAGRIMRSRRRAGLEPGLDLAEFSRVMTAEAFIDRAVCERDLGVTDDDLDAAIGESMRLSRQILAGKTAVIGMPSD